MAVATDLALITGVVFDDFTGNGLDPGEEVGSAMLNLYRDNGNSTFEPGSGDTLVASTTSDASGRYSFNGVTEGEYFVQQPAQTASGRTLQANVSSLISVSSTDVNGRLITTVDSFDNTQQIVRDETFDNIPVVSSVAAPEVLGGERDLLVNKTSANGAVQLSVNDPLLPGILSFDSILTGQGDRLISWDGFDGDAATINDSGLGSFDITSGGTAEGFQLQIGADLAGGQVILRVYTDDRGGSTANRFSSSTLVIPATGGLATSFEYVPFSSFTPSGGGADFTDVGAISMEITGVANVNGSAELVGAVGATVFTRDFSNFETADLSLEKTVDNASPAIGQNATFTITINNAGPDVATNVQVRDQLPSGIAFVSQSPSVGSYDAVSGLWNVGSLASGASATLQLVGRIDSAGTRVNFAEVSRSDQFDPDSTPDPDDTQPNNESEDDQALVELITEAIDLSLTKEADNTSVVIGQNVTFTVAVSNAGPSAASGVTVQDQLPSGISFVSSSATQGSYDSASGVWNVGGIAADASQTLTVIGRVDTAGGKTNSAQVLAADQLDLDSTPGNNIAEEDDQDSVTIQSPQIDLSLNKTVNSTQPDIGDEITFTVSIANAGPDTATGVNVRDLLPAGLTFVSATTPQGTYDSGTGIWSVGTIAPTASSSLSIVAMVNSILPIANSAEVVAADQPDVDSTPNNNVPSEDDQASVDIQAQQIDLSLTKSVDQSRPNIGDNVTFTVTVSNAGPSPATGVVVLDMLPAGMAFVSATPSLGSYNSSNGQWTVGSIANGVSQNMLLVARVDSSASLTNIAEVFAAEQVDADSTPNNGITDEDDYASVTLSAASADLSLTKTVTNAQPNVGENTTFVLTVRNAGPDPATNVAVSDLLPAGISFVSAGASQGNYDAATGRWEVGNLPVSGQSTLELIGRADNIGAKTNTAQIVAVDQFDPDSTPNNGVESEDDQASVSITPPIIDLSVEKQSSVMRPNVGQTVQFTIDVANAGPSDASGVILRDQLPTGLTFVSATTTGGSYDAGTGNWTVGGLASGATASLQLTTVVNTNMPVTNIVEVIAADQFDSDSTPADSQPDQDDYASTTLTPAIADLSLTKTVSDPTPNIGEDVTFTITLSNAGPDGATGVQVRDALPPGMTFTSATASIGSYNSTTGIWSVGNLPASGSATLALVGAPTSATVTTNEAEVVASDQFDPDSTPGNGVVSEDDQAVAELTGQQVDLALQKVVNSANPNVGDEITFTITVDNSGPATATGVAVQDVLPAGLVFSSSTQSQGSFNSSTGVWTVGELGVSASASMSLIARVDRILDVENIAQVSAADQPDVDSTPGNSVASEDDQASQPVSTQVADLELTKTSDLARPNVGSDVAFSITVRNNGPDQATGVAVLDQLPAGLQLISASPDQGSFDSTTGLWDIGDVAVGATVTLNLVSEVLSAGEKVNVAAIQTADQADPDSIPGAGDLDEDDTAQVTVTPPEIDLSLTKTALPTRPAVGSNVTYTITARNDGPDAATGVTIADQLPEDSTLVSATPTIGSFNTTTGVWNLGGLSANQTATLRIVARMDAPGIKVNRAEVTSADQFDRDSTPNNDDGTDGNGNDEDDQAAVSVTTASSDLSLTKSVDEPLPGLGSQVTFTLQVRNDGPDGAENIVIRDLLPAGLSLLNAQPSTGNYDATAGRWQLPSLADGDAATLTIAATVDTLGEKINVAEVISSSQYDPDSTPDNNVDSEDDQGAASLDPQLVDLALEKAIDNATPNIDELVRFTLTLSNSGPSGASGVEVEDLLPPNMRFNSYTASQGFYNSVTGLWEVGDVPVDAMPTLEIVALVGDTRGETNTAEITAANQPDRDSTPDNGATSEDDFASVSFRTQQADLSLAKTVSNTRPNQREELIYTVTVSNAGIDDATNVIVNDPLPPGLTLVSATPSSGTYNEITGQWAIDIVPVGSPQILQVIASVQSGAPMTNTAEIIAVDQFDPDSTPGDHLPDQDDIASVTVEPLLVDISVVGTISEVFGKLNDEIEVTFTVTNDGPENATGLQLQAALPPGMTLLSAVVDRGTIDLTDGIWTVGRLNIGESVTIVGRARVDTRGNKVFPLETIAIDQADVDSTPANGILREDDQAAVAVIIPLFSKRLFLSGRR